MARFNWHWLQKIAKGRGEWLTLLFSLLLALSIWTIHNLSLRYSTYLQYYVNINTNIEGRALESTSEDAVMVRARASGYYLMSQRIINDIFLDLDPKHFHQLSPESDTFLVYVSDIKGILEKELLDDGVNSIENFTTEFIRFVLPKIETKKVPVIAQTQVVFKPQYMAISEMKLEPDSVLIYGEEEFVDKVEAVYTKIISESGVSKKVQGVTNIIPINNISISQSQVYYSQEVGRYIEQTIELPLEVVNLPSNIEALPLTPKVKLIYRELLSSYKVLQQQDFRCVIDYNEVKNSINSQVVPKLVKAPSGIYSLTFDPPYVNILVIDK